MLTRNPMRDPVTRAKAAASLSALGKTPWLMGGNGRGPTKPQAMLANLLGWPMEVPVTNGRSVYLIDIANQALKIAVEVDGNSHNTAKQKRIDRHKEKRLASLGWCVLRFTNKQVMERLEACALAVWYTTSKLPETITISWKAS